MLLLPEHGVVTKLDRHTIEVQFDKECKLVMPLTDARKVDLGYAS